MEELEWIMPFAPGEDVFLLGVVPGIEWVIAAAFVMYAAHSLYGGLVPQSQVFGPIFRGRSGVGRVVALTFDDGPHPTATRRIMDLLEAHGARGTFFVIGRHAEACPEIVREIVRRGHEVGNHTQSHSWLMALALFWKTRDEIETCQETILKISGHRPRFYRQPVGFKNPFLFRQLKRSGLTAIGWQVRGFDALASDSGPVARRILLKVRPGGIIALHDGCDMDMDRDRTATIETLSTVLDRLAREGFRFTTVSRLLGESPYQSGMPSGAARPHPGRRPIALRPGPPDQPAIWRAAGTASRKVLKDYCSRLESSGSERAM
ncbi:MAG: polysaccharide deacetylase family protein [Nitrospirota bacterium]